MPVLITSVPIARIAPFAAMLCLFATGVAAQQESAEDRLRDVLRHVTADLRAAQDNQTALQAALDQAQKQRDVLRQQVTQLTAQAAAQPAAKPAQPAADNQQSHDVIDALKKQNATLQDGLAHWQSAYQQAASLARTKDAEDRRSTAAATTAQRTLDVCQGKNTKLIAVANDILHLYETPRFRSLAASRWDTVLGFKKVELENIVQDNEDRIFGQKYYPGEQPPATKYAGEKPPAAAPLPPGAAASPTPGAAAQSPPGAAAPLPPGAAAPPTPGARPGAAP